MRAIETQGVDGVFSGLRLAGPFAIGSFEEVDGEIFDTEIDECDLNSAKFRRRPLRALRLVADVARPVEVVEIQAHSGKFRLGAEVIELEVFGAGGPFFFQKAVGTGGAEIFADGFAEALIMLSLINWGGGAAGKVGHGLLVLGGNLFQDGGVEQFVLDLKARFEAVQFRGFFNGEAAGVFALNELMEAEVGGIVFAIERIEDLGGDQILAGGRECGDSL